MKTQYTYFIHNKVLHDGQIVDEKGLKKVFGSTAYHVMACIANDEIFENSWCTVTRKVKE